VRLFLRTSSGTGIGCASAEPVIDLTACRSFFLGFLTSRLGLSRLPTVFTSRAIDWIECRLRAPLLRWHKFSKKPPTCKALTGKFPYLPGHAPHEVSKLPARLFADVCPNRTLGLSNRTRQSLEDGL